MGNVFGNRLATFDTDKPDARVEKIIKKLELSQKEFVVLFKLFGKYDKTGEGYVTRDDFFQKILDEPRNALGNTMLDFVHPRDSNLLTFGEFLECFYTFCLFEPMDMIRFIFLMFDTERTGFVDKDEIRHFIYMLHQTKENATIEQGLAYLEDNDDGDGRFEFYQIKDMHFRFQILFYPAFRILVQMRRCTLGEDWWEKKNFQRQDDRDERKRRAERDAANEARKNAAAAEMANEDLVKRRMGINYYLMFWERRKVRLQISRIAAISSELDDMETDNKKPADEGSDGVEQKND